jgi:hypothetical protein
MAALEKVAAEAEIRSERCRQQAEAVVKRAESSEAKVVSLEQAIIEGKVRTEQWREQTEAAAKLVKAQQENSRSEGKPHSGRSDSRTEAPGG